VSRSPCAPRASPDGAGSPTLLDRVVGTEMGLPGAQMADRAVPWKRNWGVGCPDSDVISAMRFFGIDRDRLGRDVDAHETLPGGRHVGARWWPLVLSSLMLAGLNARFDERVRATVAIVGLARTASLFPDTDAAIGALRGAAGGRPSPCSSSTPTTPGLHRGHPLERADLRAKRSRTPILPAAPAHDAFCLSPCVR